MTPAEVSGALAAAVGVADVPLRCLGAGVYGSPVALRLGLDAGVVAERLERAGIPTEVSGGFLTMRVAPGGVVSGIVAGGVKAQDVVAEAGWADRPRVFENPGFCVRFAYARAVAVVRRAEVLGVVPGEPVGLEQVEELALLTLLGEMDGRARQGGRPFVRFLERLALGFHDFYERCPALPVGDEKPGAVHAARVMVTDAVRIALNNGLNMIGETPRERL
ncbi:DALR anticodon-binding domain-containing protein [Spirillospora sp. CA-294931]|uniref:DALR anticodon-binding domain-containing protein n=1 Tax=Spirillospora sp. CA-294931 TaxID=3240042 RepID=UPI003D89DFAA